ncbi:MAG: hypothetical protein RL349_1256, partial [Bacteroidota bacterium]
MQKIIKLFKAIWLLLKRPALFNLILKDEEVLRNEFEKVFPALKLQEFDPFAWTEAQE